MSKLSAPHFTNEDAAREYLENLRWPHGPVCPHCGVVDKAYATKRPGKYRCAEKECRKDFTVKVGTVFEDSKIPLHKWLLAAYLLCSSKKGMSSHQLHRTLEITYKSAWFMTHRIREAMTAGAFSPVGGPGQIVEADETEISPSRKTWAANRTKRAGKPRFLALVERGGIVRSKVITERGMSEVRAAVRHNVAPGTILHTDGAQAYKGLMPLGQHEGVDHSKMFARDSNNGRVYTNTAEGYFSLFKRGLVGTYQHMGQQHLHRYLAEFDFRMSNRAKLGIDDMARTEKALLGIEGKRLTYRRING
jgi:transposase-like protein